MNIELMKKKVNNIKPDILGINKEIIDSLEITKIRPDISVASLRKITEKILCDVYEREYNTPPKETIIQKVKNQLISKGVLSRRIKNHVDTIQDFGNMSIHHSNEALEKEDIEMCYNSLITIYKWYISMYAGSEGKSPEVSNDNSIQENTYNKKDYKTSHIPVGDTPNNTNQDKTVKKKKSNPILKILLILVILTAIAIPGYYYIIPVLIDNSDDTGNTADNDGTEPLEEGQILIKASDNYVDKIVLEWEKVEGAKSYQLFKASRMEGVYTQITETQNNTYTDLKTKMGYTYFYKLRYINENDEAGDYTDITSGKTILEKNVWVEFNSDTDVYKPEARSNHAMAKLTKGKAVLFGGKGDKTTYGDTWIYELEGNRWVKTETADSPEKRSYHAMTNIGDNKILLFGGRDEDGGLLGDTWILEMDTKNGDDILNWRKIEYKNDNYPPKRAYHALAFDNKNTVVLFGGGQMQMKKHYRDVWEYDTIKETWSNYTPETQPGTPKARINHAMATGRDGEVILFGGYMPSSPDRTVWRYNTNKHRWLEFGEFGLDIYSHAITLSASGYIISFGGYKDSRSVNDTYIYNVNKSDEWNLLKDADNRDAPALNSHATAEIDGNILITFGGKHGMNLQDRTFLMRCDF